MKAANSRRSLGGREYVPQWMGRVLEWWLHLEEPPRTGLIQRVISHSKFDMVIGFVIFCNAMYTAYQANYEMNGLRGAPPSDVIADPSFLAIYLLELAAKLWVHRLYYFVCGEASWNIFDFVLVFFSVCDALLTYMGSSFGNVTFARSLRLFKVGKILRIFRAMRFLKELRVMMASIVGSFTSLFWSFIMIGMILYIFALFFIQQMTAELSLDPRPEEPIWIQQRHFFSSVERTCLTLLESSLGGLDWDVIYMLIEPLGFLYVAAFVFYIAFFNFAVLNILTGIFVENAMKLCKPSDEELSVERRRKEGEDARDLRHIIQAMDPDDTGRLSKDDFTATAAHPEVVQCFAGLGIDVSDAELFFDIASGHAGDDISIDELVQKAVRMKGQASTLDVNSIIHKTGELQEQLQRLNRAHNVVSQRTTELGAQIGAQLAARISQSDQQAQTNSYSHTERTTKLIL